MIVFLLIGVGAALALTAQLTETIQYGYAAVGVALVAVLLVSTRMWVDWRGTPQKTRTAPPTDEKGEEVDSPDRVDESETPLDPSETLQVDEFQEEEQTTEPASEEPAPSVAQETADDVVRVIPGRKRFHQPGCALLAGRTSEELTREEAGEEGFTPCSLCCVNTRSTRSEPTRG